MEKFLAEDKAIKQVIGPVDLNAGNNTGARCDMKNVKRAAFVISLGAGTSTAAHSIILKQHTLGSGGSDHALDVDNPYYHKIDDADVFTKVEVETAASTYDLHSLLADDSGIVVFEVLSEQLREDCEWVSVYIGDVGGAQVGSVVAILEHEFKPAYEQEV